jgi:hypothetical protein
VSEIEFCTLYVVAERWILGCMLRFVRANNDFSDTLFVCPESFRIVPSVPNRSEKMGGYFVWKM